MARAEFVQAAMSSPLPNVRDHRHPYNCHMAVLNWALRSTGNDLNSAVLIVDKLASQHCTGCLGGDLNGHETLQNEAYAKLVSQRTAIDRAGAFDEQIAAGDVVVTGGGNYLNHSMVAVEVNAAEIWIRGFNNAGTFADAVLLRSVYDDTNRNLTTANMWNDPGTGFFVIAYETYVYRINQAREIGGVFDQWRG